MTRTRIGARPADGAATPSILLAAGATLAIATPTLLAFNLPPSSTFLNQAAALIGWGGCSLTLGVSIGKGGDLLPPGLAALHAALALLLLAALAAPLWAGLPWSLALSAVAMIGAAGLVAETATRAAQAGLALPVFRAFCIGLVVAGALCSAVGIVQVFAPGWTDGNWIAHSTLAGRAVGNMRQPNHLSSLLLWAIVAAVWLSEARVLRRGSGALLALLFVFVVVLTGSRTGALSMLLLTAWGALDRRLSRPARGLLIVAPLLYGACWLATGAWADATHHVFGGETRFSSRS